MKDADTHTNVEVRRETSSLIEDINTLGYRSCTPFIFEICSSTVKPIQPLSQIATLDKPEKVVVLLILRQITYVMMSLMNLSMLVSDQISYYDEKINTVTPYVGVLKRRNFIQTSK